MKTKQHPKLNPVAKYFWRVNTPKVYKDRTKYSKNIKHKGVIYE